MVNVCLYTVRSESGEQMVYSSSSCETLPGKVIMSRCDSWVFTDSDKVMVERDIERVI
jgi:hypothetical protein